METQIGEVRTWADTSIEKIKSQLNKQMAAKIEITQLDKLTHQLHAKADQEQMQELLGQVKTELAGVKKDVKKKAQKKKTAADISAVKEQEFANEKLFEEIRAFKDKLSKLANQFDKELLDRDKTLKQYQTGLWQDIQQMLQQIQEEIQATNTLCQSIANAKADQNEMNEIRSIVTAQAQEAVTMAEFNATVGNLNQDLQQKLMDLRSESFSKIAELNQQTMQIVSLKANQDDFR